MLTKFKIIYQANNMVKLSGQSLHNVKIMIQYHYIMTT